MINKALIAVCDDVAGWGVYGINDPHISTKSTRYVSQYCGHHDANEMEIEYSGLTPLCGINRVKFFDDIGGKEAYNKLQETINKDISGDYLHSPYITRVIFNGPATIVFFKDGGKEVVKCKDKYRYNPEVAILYAVLKHTCDKKTYDNDLRVIDEMVGGPDD